MSTAFWITAAALSTPIVLLALYALVRGALSVIEKLREGESLWLGPIQARAWHRDFMLARAEGGEMPSPDAYCLRRRAWRRFAK